MLFRLKNYKVNKPKNSTRGHCSLVFFVLFFLFLASQVVGEVPLDASLCFTLLGSLSVLHKTIPCSPTGSNGLGKSVSSNICRMSISMDRAIVDIGTSL